MPEGSARTSPNQALAVSKAEELPAFFLRTVTPADRARRGWFTRNRHLYPLDWDLIAEQVKSAAGWCCQACDAPHGPPPHILTVDHVVDHDPANVDIDNLAALCQRCHLRRQGMSPPPRTKEEAIRRLRRRHEGELMQGALPL